MSLVHLDQGGVVITDGEASFPGGRFDLAEVSSAWVEARRPGYLPGALMAAAGAALLLRGVGLLKLLGLGLVVAGVLRARATQHVLVLRLRGDPPRRLDALRTADGAWARQALAALDRARRRAP